MDIYWTFKIYDTLCCMFLEHRGHLTHSTHQLILDYDRRDVTWLDLNITFRLFTDKLKCILKTGNFSGYKIINLILIY